MKMTITDITCDAVCSNIEGNDDLFLLIQADCGPPIRYPVMGGYELEKGQSMELPDGGLEVDYETGALVQAFDQDSKIVVNANQPDYLFSFACTTKSTTKTFTTSNPNGASYTYTRTISS